MSEVLIRGREQLELFELLQTPVWIFDIDARAMWWANAAGQRLWEAPSLEALLARDFSDMSESTIIRLERYRERFARGERVSEQWTFYPLGAATTVRCRFSGVRIEHGRPAMLCEAVPPDESRLAVEGLRGVEALRHTTSMISLYAIGEAGFELLMANPMALQAFPGDGAGSSGPTRLPARILDAKARGQLLAAVEAGEEFRAQLEVETAAGRRWHALVARPTRDPLDGGPALLVNEEDVTEHTMLLAHHEYARETFASVIERHADGLLIVDGAGECRYANATCEQMAGERAVAEVQRWGPLELGAVHEVDIAGGVGELRVLPTSWEGEPAFMVMIRDVSELRAAESERARLEERVRQAQRLDSLGRLAGGVAHDFNNLLSVILGTAEFLSDGMGPDHAHAEDVAAIVDAALRGRELTQQMLAIGRQHHGSPRVTDIHELILGLRELMAKLLGEHVLFELDLCAGSGRVLIDPWQFEQIVLNLTGNARDAMNRGGSFSMSTRTCELDDEHAAPLAGGRYIELVARDTGEGMSPEVCEHIFDPFFTTKEVGEGTGLGLATVYGIVQLAGGSVRVDSEPGRGACFTILLPEDASEDDAASDDADAGEASGSGSASTKVASKGRELPQGSGRILLVEDEPTVRKLTARILERGGYEVKAASGPLEALELARGELEIDLVLTDVVMPEMSGPELVAELLAICGPLPVVYVSGYAKSTSAWLGDMPGFLPKPFTPAALLAKVAELLDGGE